MQHLEQRIHMVIIDPLINEKAKLSRKEFLERISCVKSIRTREIILGFYLDDSDKLSRIENLHRIANTGDFKGHSLTNYDNVFAISIPNKLYSWLKNTTSATLQKQILNWHAAYYTFNSFQEFAKQELTPLVLPEVKSIIEKYYPMNYKEKFFLDDIEDIGEYETKRSEALEFYYNVSERYVGSLPPEFLRNPYQDPYYNKVKYVNWGLLPNCNFSIEVSYFTKYDWIIIVERSKEKLKEFHSWSLKNKRMTLDDIDEILKRGEMDTLQRSESNEEMWLKWKHTFINFENRKEYT